MAIKFFFSEVKKFPFVQKQHKIWIANILSNYGKTTGDISVVFCSDEYLLNMNKEYLNHDYFTDVITFNYCEENIVSGDLFISVDRIVENALTNNVSYLLELERVIIHGILHLVGFDDISDNLKSVMTDAENSALKSLYTVK